MTMQANAEPDLAQTGPRLMPVMASLISGTLDLVLQKLQARCFPFQAVMLQVILQGSREQNNTMRQRSSPCWIAPVH